MKRIKEEPKKRNRNVAHLWADKRVVRFFRKNFSQKDYKNLRSVYLALCEIESDFGEHAQIYSFTKTVATYSGMTEGTIRRYLRAMQKADLIDYWQTNVDGKFGSSVLCLFKWEEKQQEEKLTALNKVLKTRPQENTHTVKPAHGKTAPNKNTSKEVSFYKNPKGSKKSVFAKTQKTSSQEKRIFPKEKILKFFSHLPDSWDGDEKLFQALSSYITHRQELGRGLTPTAIKTMAKKFSDYPKATVIKALKASVENGWTGVFPENLEPKETQEKETTPPTTIIKDHFNEKYNAGQRSKSTITRFTNTIFKPAVSFLPKHANGQASVLARNTITLFEEIEKTQSKIPDKKRVSLPGGLDILKDYVAWLDESDWITNKDERLFNINSKVFKQFSQEAAQEWGGVNPVFG